MTLFYKVAYRVSFTPWEGDAMQGPAAELISGLFEREESGRQPPTDRHSILVAVAGSGRSSWRHEAGRSRVSTSFPRHCTAHANGHRKSVWR
jgi:hypothetical protein